MASRDTFTSAHLKVPRGVKITSAPRGEVTSPPRYLHLAASLLTSDDGSLSPRRPIHFMGEQGRIPAT